MAFLERCVDVLERWEARFLHAPLAPLFLSLIATAIIVIAAVYARFHVSLNDFWGNLFAAATLDLANPASLRNGFYPVGYPALLRVFGQHAVLGATCVNLALWAGTLLALGILARRMAGPLAAVLSIAVVVFEPSLFGYATSAVSDVPANALFAAGATWGCSRLLDGNERVHPAGLVLLGAVFGAAALFRYHLLVASVAMVAGFAMAAGSRKRTGVFLGLGVLLAYGPQIAVNIAAGYGPFDTAQGFNVQRMTYGVDWFTVSSQTAPGSVLEVVKQDPSAVGAAYGRSLLLALPYVVAFAAASISRVEVLARVGRVFLLATSLYALVVSLGASSRAWLPFLPFVLVISVCLAVRLIDTLSLRLGRSTIRRGSRVVAMLLLAAALAPWIITDLRLVQRRRTTHLEYLALEQVLFAAEGARAPGNVFTSDFDLYFPSRFPHAPFRNGGWMRFDLYAYEATYPALCTRTVDCFLRDCRARSISHVVLTPAARRMTAALGRVYDGDPQPAAFAAVAQIGPYRVYRVAPESR